MELKVAPQYREDLDCLLVVCGCQSALIHQRQKDRRYIKGRRNKTRRRLSDSHECSDAGCFWTQGQRGGFQAGQLLQPPLKQSETASGISIS